MSQIPAEPTVGTLALQCLRSHKRILLLQGPVGGFFSALHDALRASGSEVFKINFNGGDEFFYRRSPQTRYTGSLEDWPAWLERFIRQHGIEAFALLGEWRAYHRAAWHVAERMGVRVYVFEEGYLRPNYITLEPHGVNGSSLVPREASYYRELPLRAKAEPRHVDHRFLRVAIYAMLYYLACFFARGHYPFYIHHRPLNPLTEGWAWLRSGYRKLLYKWTERRHRDVGYFLSIHKKYFLVPLQVHIDSQVKYQSRFESVGDFIVEIVESFARHAPVDNRLVIKHHPMDRGYTDYARLVKSLAEKWALGDRLIYVHDTHLPSLLKHARGVVTINSTVGLSAFYHQTPVKLLGKAVYDVPGLVYAGCLEHFWQNPGEVDEDLFLRFKRELINTTQLNAGFYVPSSYDEIFLK
ncbi:MAG: capsular biosynthesis protein [Pseudomonadota bacterium]